MRRQNNEWGKLDNRKVWQKVWKMKRSRNRLERHMICNLKPTFQGKELLFHCKISTPIEKYSPRIALVKSAQKIDISRAAIAQWIYLFLPFWGPRFESDHAFSIYSQILYYICLCIMKRGQKYTKRVWFIFKINRLVKIECTLTQSACFICSVAYYQPTYLPTYLPIYLQQVNHGDGMLDQCLGLPSYAERTLTSFLLKEGWVIRYWFTFWVLKCFMPSSFLLKFA